MYSCGPFHIDEQRQDVQLEPKYSNSVLIQNVAQRICWKQWTIGRCDERGSGISVLIAWHDDDDIYIYIYIYIYIHWMTWWWYIYIYIYIFTEFYFSPLWCQDRSPQGEVAIMLDCNINEFKLHSYNYIHIWTNALEKGHESLYPRQLLLK